MIRLTQGSEIDGLKIVSSIDDNLRKFTVYVDDDNNLFIGLGGTRNSLMDWFSNLEPTIEAMTFVSEIKRIIHIYDPSMVTLIGHSQGGAHAVIIGQYLWERMPFIEFYAETYGGLPTRKKAQFKVINFLRRDDPMAWVPWWVIGLSYSGKVVKIGPWSWPKLSGHETDSYLTIQ